MVWYEFDVSEKLLLVDKIKISQHSQMYDD
jgi:hypothetical protein